MLNTPKLFTNDTSRLGNNDCYAFWLFLLDVESLVNVFVILDGVALVVVVLGVN